uniref:Uncharacterized protein n=1 Tax=Erpetoichthys calabaricus TaxID=27687 RepID=A0A8C4S4W7_ERPCA
MVLSMCFMFLPSIIAPPEPPSNPPEILDITKSSVSLSWSRPKDDGGSRVIGYFIDRKEISTDKWVRHNKTHITTTMYTVTGLVPDAEYQFRVIAQNDIGPSQLTCQIIGRPLPDIKWYRYGKELIQSRKYKMSSDGRNHSLTIVTEEQEDEGLYTCRAINDVDEIETSGKLFLQAPPQFHPGFPLKEKYYASAGTSLRLHVVYIGRPVPAILWFHAKKPLKDSENVTVENTEHYTHLVIRNVQRKAHTGKYKVQLSNILAWVLNFPTSASPCIFLSSLLNLAFHVVTYF